MRRMMLFHLMNRTLKWTARFEDQWLMSWSTVANLPYSHNDQTPESTVGHGEEHRTLHGQAEASSQMNVDDGDWDEKPNYLSHHHWSIYQINPLVERNRRVRLN